MGLANHETIVTSPSAPSAAKTEMTMRHEFFESKEARDSHNQGWNASFEKLAEMLA